MGMFSVSCGLTGISISGGEKVALFPLIPQEYEYRFDEKHSGSIVSNAGPHSLFQSLAFPIFGEYDSYGRCERVMKDTNTKVIEKHFGISIEEFSDIVTSHSHDLSSTKLHQAKNQELLVRCCGMFMLKDIYDAFIKANMTEFGKATAINDSYLSAYVLKKLGFKETGEADGRYNRVFTHSDMPKVEIFSDGRWAQAKFKGKEFHPGYRITDFKKELAKFGFELDYCGLDKCTSYEVGFDALRETLGELEAELSKHKGASPVQRATYEMPYKHRVDDAFRDFGFTLGSELYSNKIEKMYWDTIKNGSIRKAFNEFRIIDTAMWLTNSLYMPKFAGPQCGAPRSQKFKGEVIVKYTQKIIDEYGDEDYDEEDE